MQWKLMEELPDELERVVGYSHTGSQDGQPCIADIRYAENQYGGGWWEATDGNPFYPTHWDFLPDFPTQPYTNVSDK